MELKIVDKAASCYFKATVRVDFQEGDKKVAPVGGTRDIDLDKFEHKVLGRLRKQNRKLNLKDWEIINRWPTTYGQNGMIFRMNIPNSDIEELQKTNCFIYYGSQCLKVNFGDNRKNKIVKLDQ